MNVEFVPENILRQIYAEVNRRFPTDADCLQALRNNKPLTCNHCGVRVLGKVTNRKLKCRNCKKITHISAKTAQRHIKKPRAHLTAILLLGNGIIFSAAALARLTNISGSSAQAIVKRYALGLSHLLPNLELRVQSMRLKSAVSRRSKSTPADKSPREEYIIEEKRQARATKTSRKPNENLTEQESAVLALVGASKTHFDTIFSQLHEVGMPLDSSTVNFILHSLCLNKMVECINFEWYARTVTSEATQVVSIKLDPAVRINLNLIRKVYGGVSKKYMQLYLTMLWIFIDRQNWSVDALTYHLSTSHYISNREILNYNSPDILALCALNEN